MNAFRLAFLFPLLTISIPAIGTPALKKGRIVDEPDPKLCHFDTVIQIKGETPAQCSKSAARFLSGRYRRCATADSWLAYVSHQEAECHARLMESALERRLLALRESPNQLRREKELQGKFLDLRKSACDAVLECGGTAAQLNHEGCLTSFNKYRAEQALAIAANRLAIAGKGEPSLPAAVRNPALPFVSGLCAMPDEAWRDGKPPAECEKALLAEMRDKGLLFADPCGG